MCEIVDKCMSCSDELGLLILKTATKIRRQADSNIYMTEVHKITGANGWILGYLVAKDGEDIYQKDIEENFGITRSTVSKALKSMEAKGLIHRESVASDARLKKLVLTEEGRRMNALATEEREQLEEKVQKGLTEDEVNTLKALLHKVSKNL